MTVADQIELLRGLRQIRQLKPEPIPAEALQDILKHPDFDTYDEGRLSERIMLAADVHGLASAIGWFKGSASDEAKRLLGVPSERLLRTIMSIGVVDADAYRARQRPPRPRKPLTDIIHQERW